MRVAVVQLHCPALEPPSAVAATVGAIHDAAAQGADLVVLPELAGSGYVLDATGLTAVAEDLEATGGAGRRGGPVTQAWCRAARDHGVTVVGGLAETAGGRLFNTAVVVSPQGEVCGRYRKLHLFGTEQDVFTPGDVGLPVFDVGGLRLGVLICYDLRFPEAMRVLALQGAEVIAVPTAWVRGFDTPPPTPADRLGQVDGVQVQANLNQVWVACADQVGRTDPFDFLGRSLVVDPYGQPRAGPASDALTETLVVDVDPTESSRAQERGPGISPRRNRRTDVYGDLLGYRPPVAAPWSARPLPEEVRP